MKRYLGFIAVLIMAIGLSLNVAAAEGDAKEELTVNEPVQVKVRAEENTELIFTPSKTQRYVFVVEGRENTYYGRYQAGKYKVNVV